MKKTHPNFGVNTARPTHPKHIHHRLVHVDEVGALDDSDALHVHLDARPVELEERSLSVACLILLAKIW